MSATTTLPLVTRFALILAGLQHVIAAAIARQPTKAALIVLAHNRLARMVARFASVVARADADTLHPSGPRHRPAQPRTRKPEDIHRGFAWLLRLGSWQAAAYRSQLQHLLADPEMERLLQAAPKAGRILRPLCHALGIRELPDRLRLRSAAPAAPADTHGAAPPQEAISISPPAPRQAEPPDPSLASTFSHRLMPDPDPDVTETWFKSVPGASGSGCPAIRRRRSPRPG